MAAEEYTRTDELVYRYQQNDKDAALELIESFKPYMNKYLALLKARSVNCSDIDVRRFLALFTSDIEVRKLLKSKATSYKINCIIYDLVDQINKQLTYISSQDLEQDMCRILLMQASRYQDQGKNFCFYLYNTFRYELKRTVEVYVSDPINYTLSYEEVETDNLLVTDPDQMDFLVEADDALDINWIQGLTCSDLFFDLCETDRLILKLHYEMKYNDQKIADILGVHKNTVFRRRSKAIKKVESRY